uniref:Ring cleavage dioxygenase n=1 Tax=Bacillus subtilis TaxID=1423 RepID=A0A2P1DMD6_BACIU|nr:ring cleavage dioxygenase [Bacillus subtilis]
MAKKTMGIHHITAIVGHPQENTDFYAGVLGLRLVKQTVNFDDPGTYHLYFGNEGGKPGTIITFFPWAGARQGVIGDGQVGVTSYVVPKGAMAFWEKRLEKFNVPYTKIERFGEQYVEFDDPHGLHLEIVEREEGEANTWTFGDVTPDVAIKGFGGATLLSAQPDKTADLLENIMGLERVGKEGDFVRYRSAGDIGNVIDLKLTPIGRGQMGAGTVHHIAWRAILEDSIIPERAEDIFFASQHIDGSSLLGGGITYIPLRGVFSFAREERRVNCFCFLQPAFPPTPPPGDNYRKWITPPPRGAAPKEKKQKI